jgi:hypothetical protein
MTEDEYYVRGSTALLDAVGGAIHHIGNVHKYARKEDVPEKTIFVIMTDGYENASRRYDYDEIRRMITRQKKKYDWEFMFLGANIDAAEEACSIGISRNRAANFHADSVGQAMCFEAADHAIREVRCSEPIEETWKAKVEADYKRCKK